MKEYFEYKVVFKKFLNIFLAISALCTVIAFFLLFFSAEIVQFGKQKLFEGGFELRWFLIIFLLVLLPIIYIFIFVKHHLKKFFAGYIEVDQLTINNNNRIKKISRLEKENKIREDENHILQYNMEVVTKILSIVINKLETFEIKDDIKKNIQEYLSEGEK